MAYYVLSKQWAEYDILLDAKDVMRFYFVKGSVTKVPPIGRVTVLSGDHFYLHGREVTTQDAILLLPHMTLGEAALDKLRDMIHDGVETL